MKIALIGYGKMGKMIEKIAKDRGHEIVSIIDIDNQQDFESEAFASADVAIEFTAPQAAYGNFLKAFAKNVKVVSGSTGWMKEHAEDVKKMCAEGGQTLFWASNFSVGVNIFFEMNKWLAEKMEQQPQYTPSITETHHIHKLDKPSGTAKTLAEGIRDTGIPRYRDIEIESIREGEVPGTHEVMWDSEEDTIVITHIAKGRRGFALGAVLAAEQLQR